MKTTGNKTFALLPTTSLTGQLTNYGGNCMLLYKNFFLVVLHFSSHGFNLIFIEKVLANSKGCKPPGNIQSDPFMQFIIFTFFIN